MFCRILLSQKSSDTAVLRWITTLNFAYQLPSLQVKLSLGNSILKVYCGPCNHKYGQLNNDARDITESAKKQNKNIFMFSNTITATMINEMQTVSSCPRETGYLT